MSLRLVTAAFVSLVLLGTWTEVLAQKSPPANPLAENAALAYWPAFASMPELDDSQDQAVRKVVDKRGPVNDDVIKIAESSEAALGELYRASRYRDCVWGTALDEGPHALLSHLAEARKLARLGCLRAAVRFHQGDSGGAIDDLSAVLTLGRHMGSDGLLISLLVQYAVETPAIELAARYLPSLDSGTRSTLAARLDRLPESKTMVDATRMEKEALLEWFIRKLSEVGGREEVVGLFAGQKNENLDALSKLSDAELLKTAKRLRGVYDELMELMALVPDELDRRSKQLADRPDLQGSVRQFGGLILPGVVAARRNEAVHQTRVSMLRAGMAVLEDGKSALQQEPVHDPYGEGPFQHVTVEGGFQLRSKLKDRNGEAVTLRIGQAAAN